MGQLVLVNAEMLGFISFSPTYVLREKRMSGAGLKLLTAFKKWAENRGAFELSAGVNSGTDLERMDGFLRKLGFQYTGGNYSMVLGRKQ